MVEGRTDGQVARSFGCPAKKAVPLVPPIPVWEQSGRQATTSVPWDETKAGRRTKRGASLALCTTCSIVNGSVLLVLRNRPV